MSAGIGGINVDGAGAGAAAGAITNINISAGTTSNNLSAFTFSNVAGGVSFGLNASTITASVPTLSVWRNFASNLTSGSVFATDNTRVSVIPFILEGPVVFSNVLIPHFISVATAGNNSSAYVDVSVTAVFYTRNVSTLSSLFSYSNTFTQSYSSNATATIQGPQAFTITGAATTLTRGEYYMILHISRTNSATGGAATTALGNSGINILCGSFLPAANNIRQWGIGSAVSLGLLGGQGVLGTAATRATLAISDYSMTLPYEANVAFELRNVTWW